MIFSGLIGILIFGAKKIKIDEDIYSVFPKGKEFTKFNSIVKNNNLNKQVIFSIAAQDDFDNNYILLDSLSEVIKNEFKDELSDLQIYRLVDEYKVVNYLQTASISFLSEADYDSMQLKLNPANIQDKMDDLANKLKGSNALFAGKFWQNDPLGLLGTKLKSISSFQDSANYEVEDGIVFKDGKTKIVFFATLSTPLQETDKLVAIDQKLNDFKTKTNAGNSNLSFDYFGTFQVAAANAVQVKKDTTITSIISLALIILLIMWFYKSILAPFYFILPAVFGVLSGLGMIGFLHPEISAISLATAGVLLGIVLDYSFHFFTHYKHSNDLIQTVKDIASPMLVGSFTTVAAFASLLFTQSVVLQNFGLIALFTLIGAALFTMLFLPVIVHLFGLNLKNTASRKEKKSGKFVPKLALISVALFTVFFLINGTSTQFDGDLNNLSFHPAELKNKEASFTGLNPTEQKKIYVFSNATSKEKAQEINFKLFKKLLPLKEKLNIKELVSTASYTIPASESKSKLSDWDSFWQKNQSAISQIQQSAATNDFSETAFQPFYDLTEQTENSTSEGALICTELGLDKCYFTDGKEHSYLTSIVVDRKHLAELKSKIESVNGTYILDFTTIASTMLDSVQKDFNFLLIFSSLLVFISLLVVYGRIELALFAFFPMVLAWIWILGIAHLFDIQFNFVNIIIATFLFGLGDDFSIFITDGLIQKYRTNKDAIGSYKTAIILSGITTIIGTGALYFAKHPAIHSIAIISVIGIATILFITLYVQPSIFNWFVTRRKNKNRGPITFFTLVYSILLFTYFFLGSLLLTLFVVLILFPFPAPKKKKQQLLNYLVSKLAKSTLYAGFQVKKKILTPELLDYSKPSIIIANHSSFLDILAVLMLHPKTIIMVKKWVYNSPVFGLFIRYSGYIFAEEGAEGNLETIKDRLNDGYSIVIFPEGTRSTDGEIHRFHKGAFLLSKELNVPIQPLLLIGIHEVNPKNDIMINRGQIIIQPLEKVICGENESYTAYSKRVLSVMRLAFKQVKKEHTQSKFWQPSIIQNFILKGPVLEWYVRVKYALERKNFERYDQLISDRKTIYDVGCGYGYLSYYLHYRDPSREIIAIDYDEEKIATADNGIKKSSSLSFETADICSYDFKEADAVFFNDVLHYIPVADQDRIIHSTIDKLNSNGILFIRDGVIEFQDRLKKTQLTELLSTKLFKFNKSEHELTFLSIEKMSALAKEKNMSFEIVEHSKTTSNVLFILKKND